MRRLLAIALLLLLTACSSQPGPRASLSARATRATPPATTATTSAAGTATTSAAPPAPSRATGSRAPGSSAYRPEHVVVVMEENKGYEQILGDGTAPYISALARGGALFTDFHAETHPSFPNYLALFSGSTQGVTTDACPRTFAGGNLGHSLLAAHLSFAGYAEGLPAVGSTVCTTVSGYARRHCPWVSFADLPPSVSRPFTDFPADYRDLPTVSFVIPDVNDDMHDGTVAQGDAWLHAHLGAYASWARSHSSLLIVLFDEDEGTAANHIPALVYGARVRPGRYDTDLTHYSMLRLIEGMYGLPRLGNSATAAPVPDIWR